MFNKLLCGEFKLDERTQALEDRLALYYKQTPDSMDNTTARKYWLEFHDWCRKYGYTSEEINRAKRSRRYDA